MIEDRNIVCFASNWFYDPTSKHHLMRLLAERNHVVWVNYHGSRRPRVSAADAAAAVGKLRQVIQGPRRVAENITVVTPLVVPVPGSRAASFVNRRWLTRQIRSVLRDLPRRPVQLWSFAPDVDYACGQFGEECVVYYCVDEFSQFSGYDAAVIREAEKRLAHRADLVVTTSSALYESKQSFNARTVLVTHGVDFAHFAKATAPETAVPQDVAALPRPIFGFWGLIQDWLDVPLVAQLAQARPDASIVLIGEAATDVSVLSSLPNVHLLGRRPYEQLPAYAKAFDAGLIPFRVNELTQAVNPIKLREYLSAGLPVVSTALPEVEQYGSLVHIARDAEAFIQACDAAAAPEAGERTFSARFIRQNAMREETWEAKLAEVCRHVASIGLTEALPNAFEAYSAPRSSDRTETGLLVPSLSAAIAAFDASQSRFC